MPQNRTSYQWLLLPLRQLPSGLWLMPGASVVPSMVGIMRELVVTCCDLKDAHARSPEPLHINTLPSPTLLSTVDFVRLSNLVAGDEAQMREELERAVADLFVEYLRCVAWRLCAQRVIMVSHPKLIDRWKEATISTLRIGDSRRYMKSIFDWELETRRFHRRMVGVVFHDSMSDTRAGFLIRRQVRCWDLARRHDPA